MDTLVLKAKEACSDSSLRGMNELRIRCISQGTGVNRVNLRPTQSDGTYKGKIQYRVLSGTGHLTDSTGTDKGLEYDVQNLAGVIVPSGESVVQIKNFDLMTDVIGYNGFKFSNSPNAANYPLVVIDTKEIKNKTFLKDINISDPNNVNSYLYGTLDDLANLTELEYLSAYCYGEQWSGSLSSLYRLKKLRSMYLSHNQSGFLSNVEVGFNDIIAMNALSTIKISGVAYFNGGDFYELLKNKSYVDYEINRINAKTANATCSYVSGTSTIPQFSLKNICLGNTYAEGVKCVELATAKSLLTLVKDGVGANKITVESDAAIKLGLTTSADSELDTLKTQVEALGITVRFL